MKKQEKRTRQKFEKEKSRVYAQKPRLKIHVMFKNSVPGQKKIDLNSTCTKDEKLYNTSLVKNLKPTYQIALKRAGLNHALVDRRACKQDREKSNNFFLSKRLSYLTYSAGARTNL
jgi:hypothetical protein